MTARRLSVASNATRIAYRVSVGAGQWETESVCTSVAISIDDQDQDEESALYRILSRCLPEAYAAGGYSWHRVVSRTACQVESAAGLDWPKTAAGASATPAQLCLNGHGGLVRRRCLDGGPVDGAIWAPPPDVQCRPADSVTQGLNRLGQQPSDKGPAITTLLLDAHQLLEARLVDEAADVELVVALLKRHVAQVHRGETERRLFIVVLNKVSIPLCPVVEASIKWN